MCDELTSVGIRVREPYELGIANISGHERTWELLNLTPQDAIWREMEWPEDASAPVIRWRDEDDDDTRHAIMDWVLHRWPTVAVFVAHCLENAREIKTNRLSGVVSPPQATWACLRGCAGLTEVNLPQATTAYLSDCTGLTSVSLPQAMWVNLSGCTGLTSVSLPLATTVNLGGCARLTSASLPLVTWVNLSGCTDLTSVSLPRMAWANLSGCPAKRIDL